jgi:hypothetical protein
MRHYGTGNAGTRGCNIGSGRQLDVILLKLDVILLN